MGSTATSYKHMETSQDTLLQGKVSLVQMKAGYRAGFDAVFLAAACPIQPGQSVLDVGCGVGAAFLCLHARAPDIDITGVEGNATYFNLAKTNAALNHCKAECIHYTLPMRPDIVGNRRFDHVITNPPYFEKAYHDPSPDPLRAAALGEAHVGLDQWLDYCLRKLHDRGTLTIIYPPERLDDVLHAVHGRLGEIRLYPLWTSPGVCKRILIRGRKTVRGGCKLLGGMQVHESPGVLTQEARDILENGLGLVF